MKHFFGEVVTDPSPAQAFFLVERVSNIKQSLLTNKIISTALAAKENGVLSECDLHELATLYQEAISKRTIIDHNNRIGKLIEQLYA